MKVYVLWHYMTWEMYGPFDSVDDANAWAAKQGPRVVIHEIITVQEPM